MTGVVETGAVIGDGEFLDLLDGPRVVNGDGGVIAQRMKKEHLLLAKTFHGAVDELDYAQNAVFRLQRDADDGAGLPLCVLVNSLGEARIVVNVGDNERFAVPGYPPGNPFEIGRASC